MLGTRGSLSPALAVGPLFQHFPHKIDFVSLSVRFLVDFVCSYALLFFRSNFVSFFLVSGPPEGCKCS